ncbi:MAG: SoxR reducing system RseC family protein [Rikenellaceae bacterium]|jgi:sigma-E factor negative regulatory protein RseC|nr:SoxR reducing system RseC family protein [Rikenellaceae bacterium]
MPTTAHQPTRIIHEGEVQAVFEGSVDVLIRTGSACGACKIKKACGMDESAERTVTVFTPDATFFRVGQRVDVSMKQAMGYRAIGIAYILPIFVVLAALATMIQSGVPEMTAGMLSLGFLVLYYFAVYLFRDRIGREIRFEIRLPKTNQPE